MVRPIFDQFRKKALSKSGVKAEYDALAPVCEINRQMIVLRQAAGLTQERDGATRARGSYRRARRSRMTPNR